MSRHLQIEFPQRDVGGLPSPKAHHVSLIPVLYTVGGWGCWTAIANFFHLAGGRGWKKYIFLLFFSQLSLLELWNASHTAMGIHTLLFTKKLTLVQKKAIGGSQWNLLVSCNPS